MTPEISSAQPHQPRPRAFTPFANGDYRTFLLTATAAMMADNIEHVISYWVMFQKFHSPALGAFAVVSHWVPYLLFGAYSGRMADRFDIRRLIQIGMLLLAGVSIGWGVMFATDSAAVWKAMVLLVIHGLAGVGGRLLPRHGQGEWGADAGDCTGSILARGFLRCGIRQGAVDIAIAALSASRRC